MKFLTSFLTAAAVSGSTQAELFFEPVNFVNNLKYMGMGMMVIFVIIGVIILSTVLISKLFSGKKKINDA